MATRQIGVQRFSLTSPKPFEDVIASLEAAVGRPEMNAFFRDIALTRTYGELEKAIHRVIGVSGFMEFVRFDLGEILRKERADAPRSLRLVIGNPLIMKRMVEHVPDAGSYAPVTILVDERPDGVHLSYDKMASFLAPYKHAQALKVAQELDFKIEALLTAVAG